MNLNKAMIIGNITRDPEMRTTPQGTAVASFSVATNQVWNDAQGQKQERVEFHNVVAWRKLAEIIGQYLKKGSKVYIEGRLQTRDWTGQDGVKRYRTEIVADNMIMLDSRGGAAGNSAGASSQSYSQPAPAEEIPTIEEGMPTNAAPTPSQDQSGSDEIRLEDIPF